MKRYIAKDPFYEQLNKKVKLTINRWNKRLMFRDLSDADMRDIIKDFELIIKAYEEEDFDLIS